MLPLLPGAVEAPVAVDVQLDLAFHCQWHLAFVCVFQVQVLWMFTGKAGDQKPGSEPFNLAIAHCTVPSFTAYVCVCVCVSINGVKTR